MNRSLLILLGALAVGTALFTGSYLASRHTCLMCLDEPTDNLAWLRTEFHLSDAEMARIRQLHDGYKPQCAQMCARIAAKKSELDVLLGSGTNLTAAAQVKMTELAALRTQCQSQMFQHFVTVSQTMPAAEGQRYLAVMKRALFGNTPPASPLPTGDRP